MITQTLPTTRFLVAKYVPDLRRMEPRNIGVVVWSNGTVAARFIGEDSTGSVRGSRAFREWVSYWRTQIAKDSIRTRDGRLVSSFETEFVDQLTTGSKQQYMLVDGGYLLDQHSPEDVSSLADELFRQLVAKQEKNAFDDRSKETRTRLAESTREVVRFMDLRHRNGFRSPYEVVCTVGKIKQPFKFDYAFHDEEGVKSVLQKVLWKPDSVYSNAFQFDQMRLANQQLEQRRCISFVFADERQLNTEKIQDAWQVLSERSSVVNVAELRTAADTLGALIG